MDSLHIDNIDVDIVQLKNLLLKLEKEILEKFEGVSARYITPGSGSKVTNYQPEYNLNEMDEPLLQELFIKIKEHMSKNGIDVTHRHLHAWLNVHRKGENLFWHNHDLGCDPDRPNIHGYFCVEAESSKTLYVISGTDPIIEVCNKNGTVVYCCTNIPFLHKVTPWEQDYERITIGFNF